MPPQSAQSQEIEGGTAVAELAALPGKISAALAEGREVDLSHLRARRDVLEHQIEQARTESETEYLEMLKAHALELSARWQEVAAEHCSVRADALERIATSATKEVDAARDLALVNMEIERLENPKTDDWWRSQGLAPPGTPPTATRVKETFHLSQIGLSYLNTHGRGTGTGKVTR